MQILFNDTCTCEDDSMCKEIFKKWLYDKLKHYVKEYNLIIKINTWY